MYKDSIKSILKQLEAGKVSADKAFNFLKDLPYEDLGFAKLDNHRVIRKGFPEVVYCGGKSLKHIEGIVEKLMRKNNPILLTRVSGECFKALQKKHP